MNTDEIKWEVVVQLNRPEDRKRFNVKELGTFNFEVGCDNDWDYHYAYNRANKWLLNQFDYPNFFILSVYCAQSNRGWKYFKIDCDEFSK